MFKNSQVKIFQTYGKRFCLLIENLTSKYENDTNMNFVSDLKINPYLFKWNTN